MNILTKIDRALLKDEKCASLSRELQTSAVFSALLLSRGVTTAEEAHAYLQPDTIPLNDPFLMADMDKAARRVAAAIEKKEKVLIYGDYDADGVTSLSVVSLYFKSKGVKVFVHAPDRFKEGYGMSEEVIARYAREGVSLIVTVDTGSKAINEIAYASSLGMETVVTDHHDCAGELPKCSAVVNPMRPDCPYPFKGLAGVGVAFKLICAVESVLNGKDDCGAGLLDEYADLLSIGTVADVMPLTGENRRIVKKGLDKINEGGRLGLRALLDALSRQKGKSGNVNVSTIGFQIAPRINASGRMANAMLSYDLLTADDRETADALAGELCALNEERQKTENIISEQALKKLEELSENDRVIVLAGDGWHEGVIGIAASRICEHTGKPTILLSIDKDTAKGSGRSCGGIHLVSLLSGCSDLLLRYGGHELAAGLSVRTADIDEFRKRINALCAQTPGGEQAFCSADIELLPQEANIRLAHALRQFEPCGISNEQPTFLMRGLTVTDIFALSEGRHTRLTLQRDGMSFTAVYFGMRTCALQAARGQSVDVLFKLSVNEYQNRQTLQFLIDDLFPTEEAEKEYERSVEAFDAFKNGDAGRAGELPSKEDFRALYLLLQKLSGQESVSVSYLTAALPSFTVFKLFAALDAFCELSLVNIKFTDGHRAEFSYKLPETKGKVDLFSASIFQK